MGVKKLKPVKKILQLRFLDNFSSTVAEECDQYDCNVSDKFGIVTPCSAPYHLEAGEPILLKTATKVSLGGKNILKLKFSGYFSKAKTEKCDQNME